MSLLAACLGGRARSETLVGGEIAVSTTWTLAGSPYVVDRSIAVRGPNGPVLTIEPGVVVKAGDGLAISVGDGGAGQLRAIGTAEEPIVFTTVSAPTPGRWGGLLLGPDAGASRVEHAVVEGGGAFSRAGILVRGGAPVLGDVVVRASANRGIGVEWGAAAEIAGVTVTGTTTAAGAGIWVGEQSRATVREASVEAGQGHGLYVGRGGALDLAASRVRSNAGGAITVEPGASLAGLTEVELAGNAQDGVRHRGREIAADETWRSFGYPYYLVDLGIDVRGPNGPVLTIEPGVVVKAGDGQEISIGNGGAGQLRAIGTAEEPIVFTTVSAPTPGRWGGLLLGPDAGGSRVEHAVVEGGGAFSRAGILVRGGAPVLRDVVVRASANRGIGVEGGGAPEVTGGTVTATASGPGVHLASGSAPRIERTTVVANAGAGILNEGSRARIRFVTVSGNGAEGFRSESGEAVLRDGVISGQPVPVRNSDASQRAVDARQQWWGSADGPAGLAGRVEADPWLAAPPTPDFAVTSFEVSTRAFPPATSGVRFDLELPAEGRWVLRLFGSSGAEARRIEGTGRAASAFWDGTDVAGATLPDGPCSFRLEATGAAAGQAAAPLAGRLLLDAALPVADLSSPAGLVRAIAGSELAIEGSAGGPGFRSYVLEAGPGDLPAAWTVVERGTVPVASGRLGSWTTALLSPGRWALRLSVTADSGKVATATARVELVDEELCR